MAGGPRLLDPGPAPGGEWQGRPARDLDVDEESLVGRWEAPRPIRGLAFAASGWLAVAGGWDDGELTLVDGSGTGGGVPSVGPINGRSMSPSRPDGEVVASVEAYRLGQEIDADHRVRFWEVDSGALVQEDRVPLSAEPLAIRSQRPACSRPLSAGDIVVLPVRYELLRGLTPKELLAQAERRSGTVGRAAPATSRVALSSFPSTAPLHEKSTQG